MVSTTAHRPMPTMTTAALDVQGGDCDGGMLYLLLRTI